jgi:hypothetical protein
MKMKQMFVALALAIATAGAGSPAAMAWEMPGMGADAETTAIKESGTKLITRVYRATELLLQSSLVLQQAAGNKVAVEKLQSALKQLQAGKPDDQQGIKTAVESFNAAIASTKAAEGKARALSAKEKEQLLSGLLNAGIAGVFDAAALVEAKELTDKTTNVIKTASSNPMKVASLTSVVDTAKFVVELVPAQATSIKSVAESLGKYAKANGIPMPTADDIKKAAEKVQKQ